MSSPNYQKHPPCPNCQGPMYSTSKMCRDCYLKSIRRPENYITRNCLKCETEFIIHKALTKNNQGFYCSRSCAHIGRPIEKKRTRVPITCHMCGELFDKHLSEIKRNKTGKHFCSSDCWYSYNRRDNHYLWSGGQNERINSQYFEWRKAVLERDHYFCRWCHSQDRLEVHHIWKFSKYPERRWDVSNGLTLCHDCHLSFLWREDEHIELFSFITSVPVVVWNV